MAKKAKKKAAKKVAKKVAKRVSKKVSKAAPARAAAPAAKRAAKIAPAVEKPRTKSDFYATVADQVGISKKEVMAVFDTVSEMIAADTKKNAVGKITIPGLVRVTVTRKPATRATTKPNPFKPGEMMTVKAKPAQNVLKARPIKALKEMVN